MEGAQTMSSVEVTSHVPYVVNEVGQAAKQALTMIGGTIEGHAKEACPVDSGLLRNSITYALGGETTGVTTYMSEKGGVTGKYEGVAPQDADGQMTVYIGTNVEYAPFVELGHNQEVGRFVPAIGKRLKKPHVDAKPFLRPAVENHEQEIQQIILRCFRGL